MSCKHDEDCMCDQPDTRPKHWSDAVGHVATAVVLVALFYFLYKCHG